MSRAVHVETIDSPARYSRAQIEHALVIAALIGRGRFILCERGRRA